MQPSATRAHVVGLASNVVLGVAKFTVGIAVASDALVADGFNSAGDVFATAIGLVGFLYAAKPPDDDHHYGHGNAENLAGLIIGGVLLATGAFIALEGVRAISEGKAEAPGDAALWVAGATILIKESLYHYARRVGRAVNSPSLLASARDHRADVLVAATVFCGVLAARLSVPVLDPLAAALVGVYIAWLAVDPIRSNLATLMDKAPPELREEIRSAALGDPEVHGVAHVRVHPLGSYYMVDLEIAVDGAMSLRDSHDVANRVADHVRDVVAHVQDVKVHVNPS